MLKMKIGNFTLLVNAFVIKDSEQHGKGFVVFGTEVVNSDDNSMIALLGESPGLQHHYQLY